jgi:hypothetical protein
VPSGEVVKNLELMSIVESALMGAMDNIGIITRGYGFQVFVDHRNLDVLDRVVFGR